MKARSLFLVIFALLPFCATAPADPKNYTKAKVNFDDFKRLVSEVEPHRAKRLVDLDTFLAMSNEVDPNVWTGIFRPLPL